MMIHIIDNRLSEKANHFDWILIDDREGKEPKRHDFPTQSALCKFIGAMKKKRDKDAKEN